jgi:hypothetical protein
MFITVGNIAGDRSFLNSRNSSIADRAEQTRFREFSMSAPGAGSIDFAIQLLQNACAG